MAKKNEPLTYTRENQSPIERTARWNICQAIASSLYKSEKLTIELENMLEALTE